MATPPQRSMGRFCPSVSLASDFRACIRDPTKAIAKRLGDMLHKFVQHRWSEPESQTGMTTELAKKCSCKAGVFYYRVLESTAKSEKKRLGVEMVIFLEHDLFQRCLVVICLEMILFSEDLPDCFPLLLQIFNLPPYYFYKVIELVLRADDSLTPNVVRHMNKVENQVLEKLAWTRDSPLWQNIRDHHGPLPTCQQVFSNYPKAPDSRGQTPDQDSSRDDTVMGDPSAESSSSSGMVNNQYGRLAAGSQMALDLSQTGPTRQAQTSLFIILPAQTVVTMTAGGTVSTNCGQKVTIPFQLCLNLPPSQPPSQEESDSTEKGPKAARRPWRNSSLCLFLRKVYGLMNRRLKDLCSGLGIAHDLQVMIWMCFEHSLVHCTHLMMDRHLDQLLMCAIYTMAKVLQFQLPFLKIMECYKSLPHTNNSVCDDVLISGGDMENDLPGTISVDRAGNHRETSLTPDSPDMHYPGPETGSRKTSHQEQRGTLISFFNCVYAKFMDHFALQFSSTSRVETPLSTLPPQQKILRPRYQLSQNHNVYISKYSPEPLPCTRALCYNFKSSPSMHLREINNKIKTELLPRRRCYAEEDGDGGPLLKRPRIKSESESEFVIHPQEETGSGLSAWQQRLSKVMSDRAQSRIKAVGHQPETS